MTFSHSLIVASPAGTVALLINIFRNKLAPKVPNNIPRNPHFRSFASFLFVSLTLFFINDSDLSRDLNIFITSFISSLEIINVVKLDPKIVLRMAASVADAAAVNANGIKLLLANGLTKFFIKDNPIF